MSVRNDVILPRENKNVAIMRVRKDVMLLKERGT